LRYANKCDKKTRLLVRKRVRFIESKQPIRLDNGTEAYENRTNSSWRNYFFECTATTCRGRTH